MKRSGDYANRTQESAKKTRYGQNYGYEVLPREASPSHSFSTGASSDSYNQYVLLMNSQHAQAISQLSTLGQYNNLTQFQSINGTYLGVEQYPGSHGRTIYIGNIPSDTTVDEILNQVKGGPIESVKVLPEKNCIFVSFLDGTSAATFYHEVNTRKLSIKGQDLKVGWGKSSQLPTNILVAVQSGASRNVFLGNLEDTITEKLIREQLSIFGHIDTIKKHREKRIGFVHFLSVSNAVKCVSTLQSDPKWAGKRVNYGKDRCAQISKSFSNPTIVSGGGMGYPRFSGIGGFSGIGFDPYIASAMTFDPSSQVGYIAGFAASNPTGNRTIYLGNIHSDATCEDICNVVRGGILHQIRFLAEKHIAFISFVNPTAATNFFHLANCNGIVIKNRRLKVGWGKSNPLPPSVSMAVQSGATRNVYIGNIDDAIDEDKLRQDFSEFGEIELINMLKDKNCAFVNFTNILSAVKAIHGIKANTTYSNLRINYGKDRCGNPPRPPKTPTEGDVSAGLLQESGETCKGGASLYNSMRSGISRSI